MKRACWYKSVLPWCGFLCLLAYEGHRQSKRIATKARIKAELALVPSVGGVVKSAEYLYEGKAFRVIAFTEEAFGNSDVETIFLIVRDKVGIFLRREEKMAPYAISLTVLPDVHDARRFFICGSSRTGEFPGYLAVWPLTGPEVGEDVYYGDYDLDGRFEKRVDLRREFGPAAK